MKTLQQNPRTLHFKVLFNDMAKYLKLLIVVAVISGFFSSCKLLNPTVMFRTKANYPYATGVDTLPEVYMLQPGDILNFRLFANQGFKIIDLTSIDDNNGGGSQLNVNSRNLFTYTIEPDSSVNLPIIGRVKVAGMNLKEAEVFIEDRYSNYYNDPFVIISVINRRVTIYPGGGTAQVVILENPYTSIIEALARAGGPSEGAKIHKVKVIRGNLGNPEIFKLDLSTPEGIAEAKLYYVRANDIIYVQPSYFVGRQVVGVTTQVLSLISSTILTYLLVVSLQNNNSN